MPKTKTATAQDAQIIMQLYELRREGVMRVARKFMVSEFWPADYEEFKNVLTGYGADNNAYLRQVLTYWDMAAAMVLNGALNEQLFFDSNSEPYFVWAKFGEYIPSGRNDFANPDFCLHLEKLVSKPQGQRRVKEFRKRIAARRAQAAKSKAAQ